MLLTWLNSCLNVYNDVPKVPATDLVTPNPEFFPLNPLSVIQALEMGASSVQMRKEFVGFLDSWDAVSQR